MGSVNDGLAMQQLFSGNEEEYDIPITTQRQTRCSHCRMLGHNIATCPRPEAQELIMRQRRIRRRAFQVEYAGNGGNVGNVGNGGNTPSIVPLRGFKIYNDNTYPIDVYWYSKDDMTKKCKYLFSIDP